MTTTFTRKDIEVTTRNVVVAFISCFGRAPDEAERAMLASMIWRYFDSPNAPSTRLQ
jgi:hypothetical protein